MTIEWIIMRLLIVASLPAYSVITQICVIRVNVCTSTLIAKKLWVHSVYSLTHLTHLNVMSFLMRASYTASRATYCQVQRVLLYVGIGTGTPLLNLHFRFRFSMIVHAQRRQWAGAYYNYICEKVHLLFTIPINLTTSLYTHSILILWLVRWIFMLDTWWVFWIGMLDLARSMCVFLLRVTIM